MIISPHDRAAAVQSRLGDGGRTLDDDAKRQDLESNWQWSTKGRKIPSPVVANTRSPEEKGTPWSQSMVVYFQHNRGRKPVESNFV